MTSFNNIIAVLDYGMGNLHSVAKALEHVAPSARVIVTDDRAKIEEADRIVFPGVGAIRDCMAEIKRHGFGEMLRLAIPEKPVLGICVGMQALMDHSEENGGVDCLGILSGNVRFFGQDHRDADGQRLKVPHMGWNQINLRQEHPLWHGISEQERFYFVHSYYVDSASLKDGETTIAADCNYGVTFAAAIARGNLFAVQFHPEKSHSAGLRLLQNFAEWQGEG
ncbi:MAG: imidazole glycerol phosphate synthase subunit HisH [bacterium]